MLGGLFDDLFDSLFNVSFFGGHSRRVRRLDAEGERVPATVYAIHFRDSSEDTVWKWGIDVQTSAGPLRTTVRQWLYPHPELAHLGATVVAAHHKGRVGIDWAATLAQHGVVHDLTFGHHKQLRSLLPPGIRDTNVDRRRLAKGEPATATVRRAERAVVFGRVSDSFDLAVDVRSAAGVSQGVLERVRVPPYALHRFGDGVGAELPVALRGGDPSDLEIDWETFGGGSSAASHQ